ncbi:signal peptidase I [Capnocytophaga canis]|uniref:Signal peptidase I n=1 Tax=Capnocytophaga canis TaxID=1848903 RepID=A0A0B7IUD6_9FLAO|nr:signal peptidase I [Capnocytophaga canis]CEN53563.1 putative Signal peptidase I [Capnocytophaga canis]
MKLKIRILYIFSVLALVSFWFMFDIVKVKHNSMSPTYNDGDYLLCMKECFFSLQEDDVVIFTENRELMIKRIVSVGNKVYKYEDNSFSCRKNIGSVEIVKEYDLPSKSQIIRGFDELKKYDYFIQRETKKNVVLRNDSFYLGNKKIDEYQFKNNFFFLEGDNKSVSYDSRKVGVVSGKYIIGKVICKLW